MRHLAVPLFVALTLTLPTTVSGQDKVSRKITIQQTVYLPAVGCDNGVPVSGWSLPKDGNGPTPMCPGMSPPREMSEPMSIPHSANSEIGTVIVVSMSAEKIVMAANSRATLTRNDGSFAGYDDHACKIAQVAPDIVMAVDGIAKTSIELPAQVHYDALELGKEIARTFRSDPKSMITGTSLQELAAQWGWNIAFRIRRGVLQGYYRPLGDIWLEGIFAGRQDDGKLGFVVAQVHFQPETRTFTGVPAAPAVLINSLPVDFTWIEAHGMPEVADTYIDRKKVTDKTRKEFNRIRKEQLKSPARFRAAIPVRLVRYTIKEDPRRQPENGPKFVGGPVDVAVVNRRGHVQWISLKESCRQQSRP